MSIRLAKHAEKMLSHRNIKRSLLIKSIESPDLVLPVKYGKRACLKNLGNNYLKAIVAEEGKEKTVITLYWLDKKRVGKATSSTS
jgi:hypothetical protein